MADSPWSSLHTRFWWYQLSSVVAVFALASRLQIFHWESCGSQLWYRQSMFAYHMHLRAYCLSHVVRYNWISLLLRLRLDVDVQHSVPWPQIMCGEFNAPLQRDGHWVKNSCGIPTAITDHSVDSSKLMISFRWTATWGRIRTNSILFDERVTHLDWILNKNIDKSHITKINNVMLKIVRSDYTVLIANIDIKWKGFSAKIALMTDCSQLGNTVCRLRFVENLLDFELTWYAK